MLSFLCAPISFIRVVLLPLMVDYSEIRHTSPSIAFFFTRSGALLDSSSDPRLQIGDFVLGDSILDLVLGNLFPLLCQSLAWFKSVCRVLRRESMGSEVRSSDLETGLSSSASPVGVETDTATSIPSSVLSPSYPSAFDTSHPFHAFKEECSLKKDTFRRFRDMF